MFTKSNSNPRHIMGIDLGSSQINVALFEVWGTSLKLKGVGASVTAGLKKGRVDQISDLKVAVNRAIQRATLSAGVRCSQIVCNIPLGHVSYVTQSAIVSSDSGHLTVTDRQQAIEKCKQLMKRPDQVDVFTFINSEQVDGKRLFFDGIEGTHLEVTMTTALVDLDTRAELLTMFQELNMEFLGWLPDNVVLGHLVFEQYQQVENLLMMDWGSQFVKLSYFRNAQLKGVDLLPYSGARISADIEICLKTTAPEAERIKIIYGDALAYSVDVGDQVRIMTKMGVKMIKRRLLAQVIEARVEEVVKLFKEQNPTICEKADRVVILGQAARLTGLSSKIQAVLDKPVEFLDFSRFPAIQDAGSKGAYFMAMSLLEYALDHGLIKEMEVTDTGWVSRVKERIVAML